MAYDSYRGRCVLFGGIGEGYLGDTWEWNGSNWLRHRKVAEPITEITRLEEDANGVRQAGASSPPARARHALAFDSVRGVTLLFGGFHAINSTHYNDSWEWDGQFWRQCIPENSPQGRYGHALAYDATRSISVLFGGYESYFVLADTWEYSVP
jgi:hypothetical protein